MQRRHRLLCLAKPQTGHAPDPGPPRAGDPWVGGRLVGVSPQSPGESAGGFETLLCSAFPVSRLHLQRGSVTGPAVTLTAQLGWC